MGIIIRDCSKIFLVLFVLWVKFYFVVLFLKVVNGYLFKIIMFLFIFVDKFVERGCIVDICVLNYNVYYDGGKEEIWFSIWLLFLCMIFLMLSM